MLKWKDAFWLIVLGCITPAFIIIERLYGTYNLTMWLGGAYIFVSTVLCAVGLVQVFKIHKAAVASSVDMALYSGYKIHRESLMANVSYGTIFLMYVNGFVQMYVMYDTGHTVIAIMQWTGLILSSLTFWVLADFGKRWRMLTPAAKQNVRTTHDNFQRLLRA